MRYCFDALLPVSALVDLREAHAERRQVHTFKSVYEHAVLTTHNDSQAHWRGESADPREAQRSERAAFAEQRFREAEGGYIDVHAWQFTPESFRTVLAGLREDGLELAAKRVYGSYYGRNEFCAVLRKVG